MEIRWYGKNNFAIKTNITTVFVDPTEKAVLDLIEADDVVLTTRNDTKVTKGTVLDWPGEFETKDVLVNSVALNFGKQEQRILSFEVDGIRICNLGETKENLTDNQIKEMGNVDILILPMTLSSKVGLEVVEEIDPKMVILSMQGEPETTLVADFLKEVGQSGLESEEKIVIKNKSDLDSDNIVYRLPAQN